MLKKMPYPQCGSILQRFELSDEAAAVVAGEMTPTQIIEALQANGLFIDLVNFFCHALPMREAIWWACLALELRASDWTPEQQRAIADSKRWVQEPDEAKRRLAERQAETLGRQCAPGWLAQAVFWNGSGSLGESGQPVVLPPDFLYAKAAAGAINTAALIPEWQGYEQYCRQVISMGLDLARGGNGMLANG
ncbi:hypothetical protein GCM10011352_05380 [Marinobacterium zhoushanense]|uniref:Twin-arginine translocation pathway signal n=1 Tax=Marinobacterium zhoushanense TaxID=1679163 RepID=A0ABQ1K088_9GAMM|nr:hypothetical protein [Marinobacterium zhoushanense]GGB82478.1 hypothetical protein GCM10011352_05380 [Marinobacterium zhoushanense]